MAEVRAPGVEAHSDALRKGQIHANVLWRICALIGSETTQSQFFAFMVKLSRLFSHRVV
jgi:hypothetical protein